MTMLRYNAGKPPVSLVPTAFVRALMFNAHETFSELPTLLVEDVARVLDFGAKKYSAHNWRKGGSWSSVLDCALRHLYKHIRGERDDAESGLPHLAHVGCNLAFLAEFAERGLGDDDRYLLEPPAFKVEAKGINALFLALYRFQDGSQAALIEAIDALGACYASEVRKVVPTLPDPSFGGGVMLLNNEVVVSRTPLPHEQPVIH